MVHPSPWSSLHTLHDPSSNAFTSKHETTPSLVTTSPPATVVLAPSLFSASEQIELFDASHATQLSPHTTYARPAIPCRVCTSGGCCGQEPRGGRSCRSRHQGGSCRRMSRASSCRYSVRGARLAPDKRYEEAFSAFDAQRMVGRRVVVDLPNATLKSVRVCRDVLVADEA